MRAIISAYAFLALAVGVAVFIWMTR